MSNLFKKWGIIGLEYLVILFSGIMVWKWDDISQRFAPTSYWTQKVETFEKETKLENLRIHDLEISLEKENRILDLNLAKAVYKAKTSEKDVESLKSVTLNNHKNRVAHLQKELDLKKDELSQSKKRLKLARSKLNELTNT